MTRERDRIQKNANKYIVKNCPAITEYKFPDKVHKDCCQCRYGYCKDIDCVIKQVIEKCKENLGSLETYVDIRSYECTMLQDILDLFDIEEINK